MQIRGPLAGLAVAAVLAIGGIQIVASDLKPPQLQTRYMSNVGGIVPETLADFCLCPFHGDMDGNGFIDAVDLAILIDAVFFGESDPMDMGCPLTRGDCDCSAFTDAVDLAFLIDIVFFGGAFPCVPCQAAPGLTCLPDTETVSLGETGQFAIPDWEGSNAFRPFTLNPSGFTGEITVSQTPSGGALVTTPGLVTVTISAAAQYGETEECFVYLVAVDDVPPSVAISGVAFGDEFVFPDSVTPSIVAVDAIDPSPSISAFLDGEPYSLGTPISSPGIHVLRVEATDDAGNIGSGEPVVFSILGRPRLEAVALLSSYTCDHDSATGFTSLDATVLLATGEFDERDVNLHTIVLWGSNSDQFPLNRKAIHIAGAMDSVGGGYNYQTTEATYQQGYWTFQFHTEVQDSTLIFCPDFIEITGSGGLETAGAFDLVATTVATVDPDPLGTLSGLGLLNGDSAMAPPEETRWPKCTWKWDWGKGARDATKFTNPNRCGLGGTQHESMDVWADGPRIGYEAWAIDECTGSAAASNSAVSSAWMKIWLEGPEDCCGCQITCTFQPKFKARGVTNPPARALAAGQIDIQSTCDCHATAIGGVQAGETPAIGVTFGASASVGKDGPGAGGSVEVAINVTGDDVNEQAFIGNCVGVVNKCMIVVAMVSSAKLDVKADADITNWYAHAYAWLWESTPGLSIAAVCTNNQCNADPLNITWK